MPLWEDDHFVLLGTPEEVIARALAVTLDEHLKALAHVTLIALEAQDVYKRQAKEGALVCFILLIEITRMLSNTIQKS